MTLFRYPGGKAKLKSQILNRIAALRDRETEFGELFIGAGAILESLLSDARFDFMRVRLNDRDPTVGAVWNSILRYPDALNNRLSSYTPKIGDFESFKSELLEIRDYVGSGWKMIDVAFKKIAIHQISFSGLGPRAGGVMGGKTQGSKYPLSCRYNSQALCHKIDQLHEQLSKVEIIGRYCTCEDFSPLLRNGNGGQVWFLDPPYYANGPGLYQVAFTPQDHENLAYTLRASETKFLCSYDDHPVIRRLYQWARMEPVEVNYSIKTARRRSELLISRD